MSLPSIPSSVSLLAGGSSASNKLAESIGVNLYNAAISIIHESDEDEGDKGNKGNKGNSDDAYSCHHSLLERTTHSKSAIFTEHITRGNPKNHGTGGNFFLTLPLRPYI